MAEEFLLAARERGQRRRPSKYDDSGVRDGLLLTCRNTVLVARVSLIPVLRDALISWDPSQVILWALNGHEALQDLLVQDSGGELLGFVSHKAVDESEGSLRDFDAGEWKVFEMISQ